MEHNCSTLIDDFMLEDPKSRDKQLCLVTELQPCTVADIVQQLLMEGRAFPLHVIRLTIRDVLKAVTLLHANGIVHKSISPFLPRAWRSLLIPTWILENGSKKIHQIHHHRVPSLYHLLTSRERGAEFVDSKSTHTDASELELQAPELIHEVEWDKTVDIWSVGLMTYHLLTLQNLLHAEVPPMFRNEEKAYVMCQISLYCDENTPLADACSVMWHSLAHIVLQKIESSIRARTNARKEGGARVLSPFEILLQSFALTPMTDEERRGAAAFMRRCLRLRPSERATAEELLQDPWLKGDGTK
ncbi:hypothetical protein AX16_007735 [Volvariella volvacea WC 439]|nr:hypothetical protein AX16_007735 [Volvariella volvacea WC 439]